MRRAKLAAFNIALALFYCFLLFHQLAFCSSHFHPALHGPSSRLIQSRNDRVVGIQPRGLFGKKKGNNLAPIISTRQTNTIYQAYVQYAANA